MVSGLSKWLTELNPQLTHSMARTFRDGRSPSTRLVLAKIAVVAAVVVAADSGADEEADTATAIKLLSLLKPVLAARGVSLVNRSTGARLATSRAARVVLLALPFRCRPYCSGAGSGVQPKNGRLNRTKSRKGKPLRRLPKRTPAKCEAN